MTSGNPRIDSLLAGTAGVAGILPGDADVASMGLVQDLLRGQGYNRLPDARDTSYGSYGNLTRQAIVDYRAAAGLDPAPGVDTALLADLVRRQPPNPVAARGSLTLALDMEFTPLLGVISLVSLFESAARFACLNLNTDRAGLSFGIIQWAQKPGRLHELLAAFRQTAPAALAGIVGSDALVDGLLEHTARPGGGAEFDLIRDPWKSRFEAMGRNQELQKVQVRAAQAAFADSLARLAPATPLISSQRGTAFLLDLTNQHGDGGARSVYRTVAQAGMAEPPLLAAME
jgi:hypothetical protein